jgi:lipid A ethanolaminephosphotransferase
MNWLEPQSAADRASERAMTEIHMPRDNTWKRPEIGSLTLCLLTVLYIFAVTNHTCLVKAYGYLSNAPLAFVAFVLGTAALLMALLTLFSAKYVVKPALIFFITVASVASWFNDQFGVIIDKEMIRNAAVTTGSEAGHLITLPFGLHLLATAVLPSLVIVYLRVAHRRFIPKLGINLAVIATCLAVFVAAAFSAYQTLAGVGRQHPDIILTFNPIMPIVSAVRYVKSAETDSHLTAGPLGTDARRVGATGMPPRVLILIAGETARAADFSLGGYQRDTNPELSKEHVVYFSNTTSCGTATATSIPCMFSVFPRSEYTHRKGLETENLLDVLGHAGVNVTWLDNDTGAYNVADRVSYTYLPPSADARFCRNGECMDDILIDKVDHWLDGVHGDSVLVLHELGSHGPAYYQRYPDSFRRFVPDCRTGEFGSCSPQEIINAYDNTVAYTDHVVAKAIDKLKQRAGSMRGAVMYLSDHGESLGENGIYLHGAPYMIAPVQQTHIPFLAWLSDGLSAGAGFDMACLARRSGGSYSQDNLFHSVLGLMDVSTKVYDPSLDIFSACRSAPHTVASTIGFMQPGTRS